ncbi:hypothetical protein HDK77DRAFT_39382 [Phyllosticta capitalensis]
MKLLAICFPPAVHTPSYGFAPFSSFFDSPLFTLLYFSAELSERLRLMRRWRLLFSSLLLHGMGGWHYVARDVRVWVDGE